MTTKERQQAPAREYRPWVRDVWETVRQGVIPATVAERLWERVLTHDDRRRLGGDLERAWRRCHGTAGIWMHLRGVSYSRAVVAVATRCLGLDADTGAALLRELGEIPNDPVDAVEWAVQAGHLVVVETPRQAFWEQMEIKIKWARHNVSWKLLWELARVSKAGEVLDAESFRGAPTSNAACLTKARSRLVNSDQFPTSLEDRIVVARRASYRIDLPAEQIRVFESVGGGSIREWTPGQSGTHYRY